MAHKSRVFGDLLDFVSSSRSRSAVTLAALAFAICHCVVLGTEPAFSGVTTDLDAEIPRQIIHFAAELCRFALPLGFMVAGFATRAKAARSIQRKR